MFSSTRFRRPFVSTLLSDLSLLLDAADCAQRRALIQQVITTIWIEKVAVTAIKPAATYALLVEAVSAGINGDLDWSRPRGCDLGCGGCADSQ